MQLKWHQILYFHFMCVGLALSQNSTLGTGPSRFLLNFTKSTPSTKGTTPSRFLFKSTTPSPQGTIPSRFQYTTTPSPQDTTPSRFLFNFTTPSTIGTIPPSRFLFNFTTPSTQGTTPPRFLYTTTPSPQSNLTTPQYTYPPSSVITNFTKTPTPGYGLPAEPFILYSNATNLRSLDLVSFAQANVLGGQNLIATLGVDTVYQHIYFGDWNLGRISRSNYDGSNISIIIERAEYIEGLAVDWINRLLYWTSYPSATIEVATLDGIYRTVLINTGLEYPGGIAVDPIAGYLFWSDWGDAPSIERSFLDGSNRVSLVTSNITLPGGVTLDTSQRLIYWTNWHSNEISSVDYNGNKRRLIFEYSSLSSHIGHFSAFDISGDYLYFPEWYTSAIYIVKISSGTLVKNISVPTRYSYYGTEGFRVIHSAKQQAGTSNCGNNNGGCEQLCFHKVPSGTSCHCQFGMKLARDGKSCEYDGLPAEPFILYSNTTNLRSLDLVSFAQKNVLGGQNRIIPLAVDTVYQHIYFGDFDLGRISRSNYNGSNVSVIMERVGPIEGLAIDWINRLMYWTSYTLATIEVATLDGLYRTVLLYTGLEYPRGIAVDPIAGYIFWSDWGSLAAIERSYLDGSNRVTMVTNNITWPNGITLDTNQRLVYWIDASHDTVSCVDYEGNNRRLIFEDTSLSLLNLHGFDLDISGDYLYFSDWLANAIYEVKISSGALVRNISVPSIHSTNGVMGLRVIHSAKQQDGASNCSNNNEGCEQLCFHKVPSGTSCHCQFGMKLARDGKSCEYDLPSIVLMTNATKYVLLGTGIRFACGFSPHTNISSYIIKIEIVKDGIPFFQWMARYYGHVVYTPQYSARQNHTGKYQCKITIGAASRYSSPFNLTVGVPSGPVVLEKVPETSPTGIRISWIPISKQFWNGEEITFQVNVSLLDYTPKKSYVTKMTRAIISGLRPATNYIVVITGKTVFGSTENLTVMVKTTENFDRCGNAGSNGCHRYATCEDVELGTYICTCSKGFFGDGKECKGPPQFKSKSLGKINKKVETNVTLVCTVFADPNPTFVWKHTDVHGKVREIKYPLDEFNGNYTIQNARVEDSGTYLCNASNTLGYVFYTTEVKIEPVIVNISVEINLSNKTFNEELENISSPAYKELKNDVYIELYKFFNNTPEFEDIEIFGFKNGSVKVLFRVIFKVSKPSKDTNDVVAVTVGKKIYKQLKTGRIGKFTVLPSTLKLNAQPPPPKNVSYSDVRETKVDIFWEPPVLHQLFSIKRYYISYLKHGEKKWSNDTVGVSDDQSISFQLDNLESDTFYSLKVTAENDYYLGQESKRMEIRTLKVKVVSPWYYIGPIIAVACVVLLVAVACLVRRVSLSNTWRPVEDERLHGNKREGKTTFQMMERGQPNENAFPNPAFSDTLPKSAWKEIQRTSIELSNETLIPGQFGIKVVRGTFSCILRKNKEACSIKLLKENGTEKDRRELMNELKTISAISSHENILNLIGACTSEDGPLLLVLEFCPRGTLESNLRESDKSREMFINKNKIRLASEIAKGMRHLADSRIVHRDLAAKNILMTGDFTPKISNLGFSRDIYEESLYQKLTPSMPSTPWLAIESLTDGLYTTKSDVWSFAVVMWEIETGGDIPYKEYEVAKLVNQLKKGHRLSKPNDASDETYKLMLQCWDENPNNRPTFEKIIEIIQMHLVNYESLVDIPLNINT